MDPNQDEIKIRSELRKSANAFINSILQEEICEFEAHSGLVGKAQTVIKSPINSIIVRMVRIQGLNFIIHVSVILLNLPDQVMEVCVAFLNILLLP